MMSQLRRVVFLLFATIVFATIPLSAGTIAIDEFLNGLVNGVRIVGFLANDPGPGNIPGQVVATYNLPFIGVQGGVFLTSPNEPISATSDLVRFNGNGTVVFYSNNADGTDAPGDAILPTANYPNVLTFIEVGNEGNSGFTYTPLPGQPGYDPVFLPTYTFLSDGQVVPEPTSVVLACAGLIALALTRRKALS